MNRFLILLFWVNFSLSAQFHPLEYDFESFAHSLSYNPGIKYPYEKLFSVPLLGNSEIFMGNSGFSLADLFSQGGNFNEKLYQTVHQLKNTDFFTAHYHQELFTYGWTDDLERFKYIGMYWDFDHFNTVPGDFIQLGLDGNASHLQDVYDLRFLSTRTEFVQTIYYGMNKQANWQLNVGYRIKLYSGIVNGQSVGNHGKFYTNEGENNYYAHHLDNINLNVYSSSFSNNPTTSEIVNKFLFSKNFGPGLDLGLTYKYTDRLQLSASLLDLGFIYYTSKIRNYKVQGSYIFEGAHVEFPENSVINYWTQIKNDFNKKIKSGENKQNYISWRPTSFYVGLKYGLEDLKHPKCEDFLNIKDNYTSFLGAIGFYQYRPFQSIYWGASLYYQKKWSKFFHTKINFTADNFGYTSLGAAMVLNIKRFQFYIAADNLIGLSDLSASKKQSVNMGINIIQFR